MNEANAGSFHGAAQNQVSWTELVCSIGNGSWITCSYGLSVRIAGRCMFF